MQKNFFKYIMYYNLFCFKKIFDKVKVSFECFKEMLFIFKYCCVFAPVRLDPNGTISVIPRII